MFSVFMHSRETWRKVSKSFVLAARLRDEALASVRVSLQRHMSAKIITEATGKRLLNQHLKGTKVVPNRVVEVKPRTDWNTVISQHTWLKSEKLAVKTDQLLKRRGKLGLLAVDTDLKAVQAWVGERMNKPFTVGRSTGILRHFIVEPFVPHKKEEEAYVSIYSHRHGDVVLFLAAGGVDVGDVDTKALRLEVPTGKGQVAEKEVEDTLLGGLPQDRKKMVASFIQKLYQVYVDLYFTYLEINPLIVTKESLHIIDLAAKLDSTAEYLCREKWGRIMFPPPFGRDKYKEELLIEDLDARTGASLKLTILNEEGRIWTLVAGGGASVIYTDTISDLGGAAELANYGEYSGNPNQQQMYEYTKTILSLLTRHKNPHGKVLLIGGGIANFTNVAATFKGVIRALKEYKAKLIEDKVSIFVRRAGPNYQEGLRLMRDLGQSLGVPLHVFGPETHMTAIVGMGLGTMPVPTSTLDLTSSILQTITKECPSGEDKPKEKDTKRRQKKKKEESDPKESKASGKKRKGGPLFTPTTKSIFWGMQNRAIQSALDFDYVCCRKEPSVSAVVYPFGGNRMQKFFWGHKEILLPVYKEMEAAMKKNPDVDVLVNFASFRSAYSVTMEAMGFKQIRSICIVAEGIPENLTRKLIVEAKKKGVVIIGPASVGGVHPGSYKIGNTGGMLDNIVDCKLHRPGSVGYVSKSGGLSNELNNIVSKVTDGVLEGIAIGGDRYPGSTFLEHLLRFEADPQVKLLMLVGEVGGVDEYEVCEALKDGRIKKPLVAWCLGTCANLFTSDVQFGHAGAFAWSDRETAVAKNEALREAGACVPTSFDALGEALGYKYEQLVRDGVIHPAEDVPPPAVPLDYAWARELGMVRKASSFITSISDERGQELQYAGMLISDVLNNNIGVGGVVSLLWFKRCMPIYVSQFFEMCIILVADHGAAVSGAHNTIVCARAGKDLVSSLVSGLLTIGDRFGGAMNAAAQQFSAAFDAGLPPAEFVKSMRKKGKLIMGIGHRVKSVNNPDMRVTILKEFTMKNFPDTPVLKYALEVEKITTKKRPNLILNVDGAIGICFVDLLRTSGCFTKEEAKEYIDIGVINSVFVLGRSIGFIGHYMDQKRMKQGLYRHPWDDIAYLMPKKLQTCSK